MNTPWSLATCLPSLTLSTYKSIYNPILCIVRPCSWATFLPVLLFTYLSIYIHILCIAGPCPWATSLTVYLPVYLYSFSMSCRALSLSYLPTCLTMYLPVYLLSYSMSCRALSLSYSPGRIILARLGSAGVDVCVCVCVGVCVTIYLCCGRLRIALQAHRSLAIRLPTLAQLINASLKLEFIFQIYSNLKDFL